MLALFFAVARPAGATVYKWRDKRGAIHITDDWNDIPDYARFVLAKKRPGLTRPEVGRASAVRASAARRVVRGDPVTWRISRDDSARGRDLPPSRVVVLNVDGIRVPPDGRENRAFWENLVRSWHKEMADATEALESARKEEQVRARIRQYIPLKIHTDAMLEAQAKAAKFEARQKQVRRILDETIPRLARAAGANLSWIK